MGLCLPFCVEELIYTWDRHDCTILWVWIIISQKLAHSIDFWQVIDIAHATNLLVDEAATFDFRHFKLSKCHGKARLSRIMVSKRLS